MAQSSKWTFMVYLAGDNNLEDYGAIDLGEMKKVGSSADLSLVAQFDRMSDQVTRRYHLTAGESLDADCVATLPKTNTGDPQVLIDFVTWACTAYPADHYALVLWNHGAGWKDEDIYHIAKARGLAGRIPRGQVRALTSGRVGRALFFTTVEQMAVEATERAILFDDSAADFLDNIEMKRALQQAAPAFKGHLDLLGFDACLMSMLEVHYQLRDTCKVVVGSQEVEPGDGWPYDDILTRLAADPAMTPEVLGQAIVQAYVGWYQAGYPSLDVTQSAIGLSRIEPVAAAITGLADVLEEAMTTTKTLGLLFKALRSAQSFSDRDYVDLAHFCGLLAESDKKGAIGAAARAVVELLAGESSPVIAEAHHGTMVKHAAGLSIYLPARIFSPLYSRLDFALQHHWDEFLAAFV
jgi:hypothetical protein